MCGWMHICTRRRLNRYCSITQSSARRCRSSEHISAAESNHPLQPLHLLLPVSPLSPPSRRRLTSVPISRFSFTSPTSLSSLSSLFLKLCLSSLALSAPLHTIFNSVWPAVSQRLSRTANYWDEGSGMRWAEREEKWTSWTQPQPWYVSLTNKSVWGRNQRIFF